MLEFKNKKIMVSLIVVPRELITHTHPIHPHPHHTHIHPHTQTHTPPPQLDCGIHPGLSGMDSLPYTDMIEADEIDLLLITQYAHTLHTHTHTLHNYLILLLQFPS